jgi:undecaprenyl-diphosphatase
MSIIHSIILGIVEGVTEFLPISSTGHLILTSKILEIGQSDFLKTFELAIQVGAIFAVIALYWKKFLDIRVLKKIFAAFVPTAIIGLALYKVFKNFMNETTVLWALFLGGIFLIIFELVYKRKNFEKNSSDNITYKKAFLIGVFQSVAIISGVSRAAATIIGGLFLGLERKAIVEFSFLLAVPTMITATMFDFYKSADIINYNQLGIVLVGLVTSFIVAIISIKFLLKFIKNHNFIPFGIYRIILAIIFFIFII